MNIEIKKWYEHYLKNMTDYTIPPLYNNYSGSLAVREMSLNKVIAFSAAREEYLRKKNTIIDTKEFSDELNDAYQVLCWKIDGCAIHAVYPNTYLGLTKERICELWNTEMYMFNKYQLTTK